MEIHEALTQRTEGCTALLLDRGVGKPDIPACMGAVGIDGATSTIVGCVNYDECRSKLTPTPGFFTHISRDDNGIVTQAAEIRRANLLR